MSDPPSTDEIMAALAERGPFPATMSHRRRGEYCSHRQVEVDEDARLLICRHCNAPVDPISWAVKLARDWDNLRYSVENLRHERDRLSKEVADLKRERSNLRAAVKRGKARGA